MHCRPRREACWINKTGSSKHFFTLLLLSSIPCLIREKQPRAEPPNLRNQKAQHSTCTGAHPGCSAACLIHGHWSMASMTLELCADNHMLHLHLSRASNILIGYGDFLIATLLAVDSNFGLQATLILRGQMLRGPCIYAHLVFIVLGHLSLSHAIVELELG